MTDLFQPLPSLMTNEMSWHSQWDDHLAHSPSDFSYSDISSGSSHGKRKFKPCRSPKCDDTSPGIVFQFPDLIASKDANKVTFGKFRVISYPSKSDLVVDTQDSPFTFTDSSDFSQKRESYRKRSPYSMKAMKIFTHI